jgi:hypothetical protein
MYIHTYIHIAYLYVYTCIYTYTCGREACGRLFMFSKVEEEEEEEDIYIYTREACGRLLSQRLPPLTVPG